MKNLKDQIDVKKISEQVDKIKAKKTVMKVVSSQDNKSVLFAAMIVVLAIVIAIASNLMVFLLGSILVGAILYMEKIKAFVDSLKKKDEVKEDQPEEVVEKIEEKK